MGLDSSTRSDFKVGDWWVRPRQNLLERLEDTRNLESRSMEVLVCLADYAPDVVSKERLLDRVWQGAFVGDDAIAHAIWELRKAFGDSARKPTYIRTVPRKGYRLVAEVLRPQGAPLPLEGARIGTYTLGERLGSGAMGVVFEATDQRLDRRVAVKFLAADLTRDAEACRRFEREAKLAASLEHPHLATVHEVGETSEGRRYLVGPLYLGGSLKERLAEGPIPEEQAVQWLRQLVSGLGAAHQKEIVHRDVKPANLLLDEHGTLKICDFGIAKLLGATDLTRTGVHLGTPAYKSPEQAEGAAVDHRTDLWAAAVVFYEMLAGARPFRGDGEPAVVASILNHDPQDSPIPSYLRTFMRQALAKKPADRFQNAEEMIAGLDAAVGVGSLPPSRTFGRLAAVLSGLVLSVGLFLFIYQPASTRDLASGESAFEEPAQKREAEILVEQGRVTWLRTYGQRDAIRRNFRKAVELAPEFLAANEYLAFFLAEDYALTKKSADRDRAREQIEKTYSIDKHSAAAKSAEAFVYLMDDAAEKAEPLAREAVDLRPTCPVGESCDLGYLVLGDVLAYQGRQEEAVEILEEGARQGDGVFRCRLKLAQLYKKRGLPRKAEDAYKQVLALDEKQSIALLELGNFLLERERFRDAIPWLSNLYGIGSDPIVLTSLGYAQYMEQLWDLALETYQRADRKFREQGNRDVIPPLAIGDIYVETGKEEKAVPYYRDALSLFETAESPGFLEQGQHAVCLAKLGRFSEARLKIDRLLSEPANLNAAPDLLVYAAQIYALQGDEAALFAAAAAWQRREGAPSALIQADPAFIPYRQNVEYRRILMPDLAPVFHDE